MHMNDGVNNVYSVAQVVEYEPDERQIIQLPKHSSTNDEYHIVENRQRNHSQPLQHVE